MKKKYIIPKTKVVKMNVNHFLCYSGGAYSREIDDEEYEVY